MNRPHQMVKSTLGHGETMCLHCKATNREIAVIGDADHCTMAPELPPRRPLVIIEAPYAADPAKFTAYLGACVTDCHRRGESPIASVATYVLTGALNDLVPEERSASIAGGLQWYRVAERCVVYSDHGISAGMQQGMACAQNAGVPIEVRELFPRERLPGEV